MAPVINQLDYRLGIQHRVCTTGQHASLSQFTCDQMGILPYYQLQVMKVGQSLDQTVARIMTQLHPILHSFMPDWVLVHGDTSTCLAATLTAFYSQIKVAHVEAGLRSGQLMNPFPEESIRILVDQLASVCFAPSNIAKENLLKAGLDASKVLVTGNTGIDVLKKVMTTLEQYVPRYVPDTLLLEIAKGARVLLITIHRSENRGDKLVPICQAIETLANNLKGVQLLVTMHPHPAIGPVIKEMLGDLENVYLVDPLPYADFIWVLKKSYLILTDSGGIQEEAPYLGRPVLLLRESTERPEVAVCQNVWVVGTHPSLIIQAVCQLWQDAAMYQKMTQPNKSYGDGGASELIVDYLLKSDHSR
jgi:UDP-N-acetylglucosamine 2-epimerase (non-hydrolysing)